MFCMFTLILSVADPGFPQGGSANSRGAPIYDFAKISQKLHEYERIWTPGGRPSRPLRSTTAYELKLYFIIILCSTRR